MHKKLNELIENQINNKSCKQAVAELGQTQVIDEIVVEVRSGNCRWSLSSTTCPGGWVVRENEINTKLNST